MSYVIYPICNADSIRKKEINLAHSRNEKEIKPQEGNEVCMICAPGKRVIANGNIFDSIFAGEQ